MSSASSLSGTPTCTPIIPVTPLTILGPFSAPVDPNAQMMFTSPNGDAMIGGVVQVFCAPAPASPAPTLACDVPIIPRFMGNSQCDTPCSLGEKTCLHTPLPSAGSSTYSTSSCLSNDCFHSIVPGHQNASTVGMNMHFALPQFPCLPAPAHGQCVPHLAMQCAMILPSNCMDVHYDNGANPNFTTPYGEASVLMTPLQSESLEYSVHEEIPERSQRAPFDCTDPVSIGSFPSEAFYVVEQLGHPTQIKKDPVLADKVVEALQHGKYSDAVISWLLPHVLDLSLSKLGTRVVQEALEHAGTELQNTVIEGFHGNVRRLMEDFNGNYVLQKSLEVMSGASASVKFIVDELAPSGQEWSWVVRHKFGCRVAQRVVEHCEEARQVIVDAIAAEAGEFVIDEYANYVVQSILQHGNPDQKYQIVCSLVYLGIPNMTQDQIPATIVERAFEHGDEKCIHAIGQAILEWPGAIVRMACSRWGSCVVKRLVGLAEAQQKLPEPLYIEAMQQLLVGIDVLRRSKKHGRKFAQCARDFFAPKVIAGGA